MIRPRILPIGAAVLACTWILASARAQTPEPAPGLVLYVATGGSDTWSGALAAPNQGGTDGPFKTLDRARDAIRALKKAGPLPPGGVTVRVRGGTYEIAASFKLTAEHAGSRAAPVVYRAQPGEKVILTGARRITGFEPYKGAILKADVGAQGFKGIYFRQLFLDGKRQILARYPNFDPSNPHGGGFAYVEGKPLSMYRDLPQEELRVIHCKPTDVRHWEHPEQGEVIIFPRYNWINMDVPIASADPDKGTITLAKDVAWGGFKGIRPMDRFYVRNLLEELDSPGEWYLDKATWTLYFWPPEPLGNSAVRAPVTESVIEIGPKADWITIRGFTIEGCEGTAVAVRGSDHCLVAGNTIHDTGGRLGGTAGVNISGGHDCGVVGNDLYQICNWGIRLEGAWSEHATLTPTGHYADNNYIHHIGVLNGHGCGIYLSGTALRASHNLIHDTTRCGIFGGSHIHAGRDNILENNIFIEGADQQMQYSGHDPRSSVVADHLKEFKKAMQDPAFRERYPHLAAADPEKLWVMEGNKFLRNIIYYKNPKAKLYQYSPADAPAVNVSDYNLIWHFGLPLDTSIPGTPWDEWQKKGYDQHSVAADPLFVDADHDDYRLRPESPAFALGFQPIPIEKIGPYASPLRASWPIIEASGVREIPLVATRVPIPALGPPAP